MNAIYKFVMSMLAKRGGKTGLTTIQRGRDLNVELSVKQIQKTLENMGVDVSKITSPKEVEKFLNIQQSWLKQQTKGPTILGHPVIDATSPEGQGITRDLFNMLDRQSGKNVIKTDFGKPFAEEVGSVDGTIKYLRTLEPMDSMKEANKVLKGEGRYKSLSKADRKKIVDDESVTDHIFERDIKPDPEDFAHGGRSGTGLNYLLGEDDQNMRVPFGKGKLALDVAGAARRKFLQWMGGAAAGTAAAKTGLFSLLKAGKPAAGVLTSVPIKAGVDGMPLWFKPFVNQIIKKGDDVTKKFATQERQIVHKTQLPDSKTEVLLTQNLDTGDVIVDIGAGKHGFKAGHYSQPVRLEYKAAEDIMTGPDADDLWKIGEREPHVKTKTRKEFKTDKTPEEFWVKEAEFTGGHPENVKFEESTFEKFGSHGSNFDEVEKFATGKVKKKTGKASIKAEREHWVPEGDMASGGRVPMFAGGAAWKLWQEFIEKLFLKSSNKIRLNKEGLTQGQWIKKHDDLTNILKEWKMGGKKSLPKNIKEFFGMNEIQLTNKFKEANKLAKSKEFPTLEKMTLSPEDQLRLEIKEGVADVMKDTSEAGLARSIEVDNLKLEFPGITDDMINNILTDKNPQRIAEVKQTMREALEMQEKGMSTDDIINIFEKMKGRKPNATGGRVSLSGGGIAGMLGE